jgi:hypothetical protein
LIYTNSAPATMTAGSAITFSTSSAATSFLTPQFLNNSATNQTIAITPTIALGASTALSSRMTTFGGTGTGTVTLSGIISGADEGITFAGPYETDLNAVNTFTGPVIINSGATVKNIVASAIN